MLKILQVYYKDSQLPMCDFTPIKNEDCTVFFENSIIRNAIILDAHKDCDYFGVVSWNLKQKCENPIGPWFRLGISSKEYIESVVRDVEGPDVYGFVKYQPHDPINHFYRIHPLLPKFFQIITESIGYTWQPENWEHVFYSNHFVAKSEVYEKYVIEMLSPAMTIMDNMPELWQDSGYPCPLPNALKNKWGITYYPYHAFVLERLFSYFAHVNKLSVMYF